MALLSFQRILRRIYFGFCKSKGINEFTALLLLLIFVLFLSFIWGVQVPNQNHNYEKEFKELSLNKSIDPPLFENDWTMFGTYLPIDDTAQGIGFARVHYASIVCNIFSSHFIVLSTTIVLKAAAQDPRISKFGTGLVMTVFSPSTKHQAFVIRQSLDCNWANVQLIEFKIDGNKQSQVEKNWMPYVSSVSQDLKLIYSIDPLIILQCEHQNLENCTSITDAKAPVDAKPHLFRGGSNAIDLTQYFPQAKYPVIGGFGHTRIATHWKTKGIWKKYWVHYPAFFAFEENGAESN